VTAEARTALTGLIDSFNLALRDGLANQPVLWVDARDMVAQLLANPAAHGLSNTTTPACDATKIAAVTSGQITDGSSLFCNGTPNAPYYGLRDGADVSTWLFADGVHPTTGGHKAFGDLVTEALKAGGWI
jgi:outer membrane lipase/esterase